MRITAAVAALALAFALPVSAAALSDATIETAGITPDSPLSFFDKTLDSIAIALSFSTEAKVETTLAVSEERAAESAVMSSEGKIEASVAAAEASLSLAGDAVLAASKATTTETTASLTELITTSTTTSQTLLREGLAAAPQDAAAELQTEVAPLISQLAEAPKAVTTASSDASSLTCNTSTFNSCVKTNGCTEDTSANCFVACPPRTVTCEDPRAGKTCHVPDTACVNECLSKIVGCFDSCLTTSHCRKEQVDASSLKVLSPEDVQRAFQLQLQNAAAQ
jgi:hypothetical protein